MKSRASFITIIISFILTSTMHTSHVMDTYTITYIDSHDESCTITLYNEQIANMLGEIEITSRATNNSERYRVHQKESKIEVESYFTRKVISHELLNEITRKGYLKQFVEKIKHSTVDSKKEKVDSDTHLQQKKPTVKAFLLREWLDKLKK